MARKPADKKSAAKSAVKKVAEAVKPKAAEKPRDTKPTAVSSTEKLGTAPVRQPAGGSQAVTGSGKQPAAAAPTPELKRTKAGAQGSSKAAGVVEAKPGVTDEAIRVRAYELWLSRGGHGGDPDTDWHEARRQLLAGA